MKSAKVFSVLSIILCMLLTAAACGSKFEIPETTSTFKPSATTLPMATMATDPTDSELVETFEGEIIVATNTSPEEWKSKADYICRGGEIPQELRSLLRKGNNVFKFAPGEYMIEGKERRINIGNNTTLTGAYRIKQPDQLDEMLYPDSSKMAVFITKSELPSTSEATTDQVGYVVLDGCRNSEVRDIALCGYTVLKIEGARNSVVSNVLVHNYRGIYPDGEWCNMGYGKATASLWIYGNSTNIEIRNCQIQCSSHHGLAIHTGIRSAMAKDILISGTRALYCGCGMLRGQSENDFKEAKLRVPKQAGTDITTGPRALIFVKIIQWRT